MTNFHKIWVTASCWGFDSSSHWPACSSRTPCRCCPSIPPASPAQPRTPTWYSQFFTRSFCSKSLPWASLSTALGIWCRFGAGEMSPMCCSCWAGPKNGCASGFCISPAATISPWPPQCDDFSTRWAPLRVLQPVCRSMIFLIFPCSLFSWLYTCDCWSPWGWWWSGLSSWRWTVLWCWWFSAFWRAGVVRLAFPFFACLGYDGN